MKDVNKFEDKLSPSRIARDAMGNTLDSSGYDIAAFSLAKQQQEVKPMVNKTHDSTYMGLQPGSRVYYNDLYENAGLPAGGRVPHHEAQTAGHEN